MMDNLYNNLITTIIIAQMLSKETKMANIVLDTDAGTFVDNSGTTIFSQIMGGFTALVGSDAVSSKEHLWSMIASNTASFLVGNKMGYRRAASGQGPLLPFLR
jgi:hypothetical protein